MFNENEHPRDNDGKFTSKGGASQNKTGNSTQPKKQKSYSIDFNNYNDNIDWDIAEKNEKVNGDKGKSTTRKDKYGNPLVSDEAFYVGVNAVKGYIAMHEKWGYTFGKLKNNRVFSDGLETVISKAITEAGYNKDSDITTADFEQIIGSATGEEYKNNETIGGKFLGRNYQGYEPKNVVEEDKELAKKQFGVNIL